MKTKSDLYKRKIQNLAKAQRAYDKKNSKNKGGLGFGGCKACGMEFDSHSDSVYHDMICPLREMTPPPKRPVVESQSQESD